jgi:hypothetical protein
MKYKSKGISIKVNDKKLKTKVKQSLASEGFATKKERNAAVKKIVSEAVGSAGEGFETFLNKSLDTGIHKYSAKKKPAST